jgi:prepilin-type N-terminal cleavage/methylation domain-containing protein
MRRRDGFTLVELLVAFFVFSVTLAGLLPLVTQSVAALARARADGDAVRLGEERVRDLLTAAESGTLPELGVTHGQYPDPHEDYLWELRVAPAALPLPADADPSLRETSSVFRLANPNAQLDPEEEPSVFLVSLFVYPDGAEPEEGEAFSLFVVQSALVEAAPEAEEAGSAAAAEVDEEPTEAGASDEESGGRFVNRRAGRRR